MTVQHVVIIMKSLSIKTLEKFEKELNKIIDKDDFKSGLEQGEITIASFEEFDAEGYILSAELFIDSSVSKDKYKDNFMDEVDKFSDKGDTSGYVDVYDDCSHDSDNPQPCVMTRILEWEKD